MAERLEVSVARTRHITDEERQSPMFLTLGETHYRNFLIRKAKLHVCMECPRFEHDEDSQDVCSEGTDCLLENGS